MWFWRREVVSFLQIRSVWIYVEEISVNLCKILISLLSNVENRVPDDYISIWVLRRNFWCNHGLSREASACFILEPRELVTQGSLPLNCRQNPKDTIEPIASVLYSSSSLSLSNFQRQFLYLIFYIRVNLLIFTKYISKTAAIPPFHSEPEQVRPCRRLWF